MVIILFVFTNTFHLKMLSFIIKDTCYNFAVKKKENLSTTSILSYCHILPFHHTSLIPYHLKPVKIQKKKKTGKKKQKRWRAIYVCEFLILV